MKTQKEQFKIESNFENGVWYGKIYSAETGKPLPGVNIVEEGTTTGTVSSLSGEFKIKVSDNQHKLVLSFIGYQTAKLTAPK